MRYEPWAPTAPWRSARTAKNLQTCCLQFNSPLQSSKTASTASNSSKNTICKHDRLQTLASSSRASHCGHEPSMDERWQSSTTFFIQEETMRQPRKSRRDNLLLRSSLFHPLSFVHLYFIHYRSFILFSSTIVIRWVFIRPRLRMLSSSQCASSSFFGWTPD